jgi:hypothetical protein
MIDINELDRLLAKIETADPFGDILSEHDLRLLHRIRIALKVAFDTYSLSDLDEMVETQAQFDLGDGLDEALAAMDGDDA